MKFFDDGQVTLHLGHVMDVLRELPSESVQCVVTSPPYWRQRMYSDDPREIGREEHPDLWVAALVEVFSEVRRVASSDATFWLNVGDKFAAGGLGGGGMASKRSNWRGTMGHVGLRKPPPGFKPKDLTLCAFELAKALRIDGWYLRQTIIWSKGAAVEPPRLDRVATAHEYIFELSKSEDSIARNYDNVPWWHHSVWSISNDGSGEHVAQMPEELARRCILIGSRPEDTVLDPFVGSGTTTRVARRLGRRSIGIDLNESYLRDIALKKNAQMAMMPVMPVIEVPA